MFRGITTGAGERWGGLNDTGGGRRLTPTDRGGAQGARVTGRRVSGFASLGQDQVTGGGIQGQGRRGRRQSETCGASLGSQAARIISLLPSIRSLAILLPYSLIRQAGQGKY